MDIDIRLRFQVFKPPTREKPGFSPASAETQVVAGWPAKIKPFFHL
jgi:hypothetical protein